MSCSGRLATRGAEPSGATVGKRAERFRPLVGLRLTEADDCSTSQGCTRVS